MDGCALSPLSLSHFPPPILSLRLVESPTPFPLPPSLVAFTQVAVVLAPTVAYLAYAHGLYCKGAGLRRPWCDDVAPNIYSFVQDEYWDVGFLHYYEVRVGGFVECGVNRGSSLVVWEGRPR